jgi:hypothetical protein
VAPPGPEAPKALPKPSPAELLEAAATGIHGLRWWAEQLEQDLETGVLGEVLSTLNPELAVALAAEQPAPDRWADAADPVQAAVEELVELLRTCMPLRNRARALEHAGYPAAASS